MTDLEQRIRELTLREPSDTLDQRVLAALQNWPDGRPQKLAHAGQSTTPFANAFPEKSALQNGSTPKRPRVLAATITSLVAVLLIGIVIGNGLSAFWPGFGFSPVAVSTSEQADETEWSPHGEYANGDSEFPGRHPMVPELSQHLRDAIQNQTTTGSQFVESSYLSAIAGATLWEQQNGEIFSVKSHVSDRRFDMCRDCHRVGG